MGFVEEALERSVAPISLSSLGRAFKPGAAAIHMDDMHWGVDTQRYVPMEYSRYASESNPVYSVIKRKAMYLSMLPLKIYRFGEDIDERRGAEARLSVREAASSDTLLADLLEKLEAKVSVGSTHRMLPATRDSLVTLSGLHKAEDHARFKRMMALEEVKRGKLFDLLRYINPHWSLNRFLVMTYMSLSLYGQAVWFAERGESGRESPRELWWADPRRVRPIPHPTSYIMGYEYDPVDGGQPVPFRVGETVRIYYPHPDNEFQPLSPLAAARIYADHEQASIHGNMNFHKQGLQPGAVLTPKGRIQWNPTQAKKVEEDINRRMSGVDRAHRWAVFRHEVEVHRNGFSPAEAEFIPGMEYDIARVCDAYHWPIDLMASGKRTYENIDEAHKAAWTTVTSEGAYIAAEATEQLFPMFNRLAADFLAFDASGVAVLQDSQSERWEREKSMVDFVITRNEYRADQGLPPVEGGDKLYVNDQKIPIDSVWVDLPATVAKSAAKANLNVENGQVEAEPVVEVDGQEALVEDQLEVEG